MCNIAEIRPKNGSNADRNEKQFDLIFFVDKNLK